MWFGNRKTDSDLCLLQFRTAKSTSLISTRILEYICNERTLPQVAGFFDNDAKATERWAWRFYFLPLIVCINWVVNPSKIKWISEKRYGHMRGSCNVQYVVKKWLTEDSRSGILHQKWHNYLFLSIFGSTRREQQRKYSIWYVMM